MLRTTFTALVVWAVGTYYPEFLLPLLSLYLAAGLVAVGFLMMQGRRAAVRA